MSAPTKRYGRVHDNLALDIVLSVLIGIVSFAGMGVLCFATFAILRVLF